MSLIFSPKFKYTTWRRLWVALAKAEQKVGLPITDQQIADMEKALEPIDFDKANEYEKNMRHDVMAHLHAFGDQCPLAKPIIHLGATSCYVTDNTDLIAMRQAMGLLQSKLIHLLEVMRNLSKKWGAQPTTGYTHFQPAQPTTVGKRICLWAQDFLLDGKDLTSRIQALPFLGVKRATGTQASFLLLLDGDEAKVEELDRLVAQEMGFTNLLSISGQTYTRKLDLQVFSTLEGLAASCHKCGTDLRLLAHLQEMAERFSDSQVGSSAMPHKKNPIFAERLCSLARFLLSLTSNTAHTHATQWLERSLDDSANRRIVLAEGFLTADALLNLLIEIFSSLQVLPDQCDQHLAEKMPQLALETLLIYSVKKGKDRQEEHKRLRKLSKEGGDWMKKLGLSDVELKKILTPYTGRAEAQVDQFLKEELTPFIETHKKNPPPIFPVEV